MAKKAVVITSGKMGSPVAACLAAKGVTVVVHLSSDKRGDKMGAGEDILTDVQ